MSDNYSNYITKYLTAIKDINDDKYEILTQKKQSFFSINLKTQISHSVNESAKYIKHIEIAENNFALGVV